MKDDTLYKALYCGVCKSIGKCGGQCARFTLTYDIAFMSAVIHNLTKTDVEIKREHCIIHPITKKPMAKPDDISLNLGALNVILAYFKIKDDILDNGRGRLLKLLFSRGYKKCAKLHPELVEIVQTNYEKLYLLEQEKETSIDKIAHPFAMMLAELSDILLKEYKNEYTNAYFYNFGKWIYLIDALDDYDKDIKKGNYNPFYYAYRAENYSDLKSKHGEEISFIMSATLNGIESNFSNLRFGFNADLIRNISTRGAVGTTKKVLLKEHKGNKK
jgi:hypothetical protein